MSLDGRAKADTAEQYMHLAFQKLLFALTLFTSKLILTKKGNNNK